jgi:hypothetical protein
MYWLGPKIKKVVYKLELRKSKKNKNKNNRKLWRLSAVVIVSNHGTEDRGFESRQGVRILGLKTLLQCCSL